MLLLIVCACAAVLLCWTLLGMRQLARRYPPSGRFIEVDGYRLHYQARGEVRSGPPILLVHGANSNLLDFNDNLLPALAAGHRVIAIDRPGYGHSPRGPSRTWPDPARQMDLLLKACEALDMARPLVVGHSWAGALVLTAATRMPERIAGGVLLSAVTGHWAGGVDWTQRLARMPGLGAFFAWTLVWPLGQWLLPPALKSVHEPQPVPEAYADRIAAWFALRPWTFLANAQDMNELSEFLQTESRRYRDIDRPMLIIHGDKDALVPFWNHGERLQPQLRHLQLELLPGVGHAPHHCETGAVAGRIARFAAAIGGPD